MLGYLVDPQKQFIGKGGTPMAAGHVEVFLVGTDDHAVTYKNFEGVLNGAEIALDANGRTVIIADSSHAYRVEVYDDSGMLQWTVSPALVGGGAFVAVDGKVDKVNGATEGHLASLTENGDIEDSGYGPEDFAPASLMDVAVRTDIEQKFDDEKLKQGRDNIKAQKYVGGPGSFVDDTSVDQDNLWAHIGSLDIAALRINDRYSNCFTNISLSLEITVYNTGSADSEIVEHGRFNINVHAEPSNGKWIVDAGWAEYKGRGNTRLVELMRVSRNNGNGGAIDKITLYAKVPDPSTFYANAVNVSVLNNYGSIHKNDNLNSTKAIIAPWLLYLGIIFENFFGKNENVYPINKYVASWYDSYVDYSTFSSTKLEMLDAPRYTQTDGNNAVKRGDIPVIVYEDGGGAVAWPIQVSDSEQHFSSINTNRSMSVFSGGSSGNIEYLARFSSTRFMTPDIDINTVGSYLIGEDYIYPMQGQTHSISVFFEVVDPDSPVYNVKATWRRSGTDDPKEFKIAVTYFGNTIGCWHGTKTLSTTETDLVVTDFGNMVRLEIDFISTDGERWYHFEYIKEANRSRMVEY